MQFWRRDKHIDTWNRLENPEIDPQKSGPMIFNKGKEMEENSISNK